MKYLLFILILLTNLFSDISFKETRYMSAFGVDKIMSGTFKFKNELMVISYIKPEKETITYYNDKITIQKDDEINEYTFEEYPDAQYLGLILRAIIKDEYTALEQFFTIKKQNNKLDLESKPVIEDIMTSIEVIKNKVSIEKITMNMTNEDIITIEIVN